MARSGQGLSPCVSVMSQTLGEGGHLLLCLPWASNTVCFPKVNNPREGARTTVAFAVPHLHPDEVLHPEGVTDATLGEGVTATVLRAVQLTR